MSGKAEKSQNRDFVAKLCDLEIPGDINISPNGDKVLYTTSLTWGHMKGKVPVSTIWLATFGEANSSQKLTDGKSKDHSPVWRPLKDEIAFVSDRAGNGKKSAIYTMSPKDTGNVVAITNTENEQAIEKFRFSPDGNMIAFISKDEKTAEEIQREKQQEDVQVWAQDYKFSRLRVVDLVSGEIRALELEQQVLDICWNPDPTGKPNEFDIGFVTCENTLLEHSYHFGCDIHIVKADLKQSKKLCYFPGRVNDLSWSSKKFRDDGDLYFHSGVVKRQHFYGNALYYIDIGEGVCEPKQVPPKEDQEITKVQSVRGRIIAKVEHRLDDLLMLVDSTNIYGCRQQIESWDVAYAANGRDFKVAIATSDVNNPVEVYSVAGQENRKVRLSQHGESLRGEEFGSCTILSCPTRDRDDIEIDGIYLEPYDGNSCHSKTAVRKQYPTVVLVHGGPHMRITNAFNTLFFMWTPYLLSLGYGVLAPNYRGSGGRGEEFSSFAYCDAGLYEYSDVITLTQFAIEKGYADPNRLVVCGYSHGGFLTNICALRNGSHGHGWKFKAAVAGASICDIDTMGLTSDMGNAYQGELHNGKLPWTMSPEDISTRKSSMLWAFKEVMERSRKVGTLTVPPMLILHGADDERCPLSQAWGLRRALEHYSLPFEMAIYPRQGHIFHEQYFWIDMALRIGRWLERYIGPGRADSV